MAALNADVSHSVWRVAREELLYPYRQTTVQHLRNEDFPKRLGFFITIINMYQQNPRIISNILFTDEARFTRNNILNSRNMHTWAQSGENLTLQEKRIFKKRVSNSRIIGDHLTGPYVLPGRLNGELYFNFLSDVLPSLSQDVRQHI